MPKNFAIVPAAGSGKRLGLGKGKAWVTVIDRPLIHWTIAALVRQTSLEAIVVAVDDPEREECVELLQLDPRIRSVRGGETRQKSVHNALCACAASADDIIIIHDAARCLVTDELISRVLVAARKFGAVTAAIPVADTITHLERPDVIGEVLPRDSLVRIQTPQAFTFGLITEAHARAEAARVQVTDDAQLVRPLHAVHVVPGDASNIKVTLADDLVLAETLLRSAECGPSAG